ncbi:Cof-type HAD-IIB family hydrolase [Streptomyces sp. NBC_00102]|uniref:Cof-type HAD-IIB family hydrolase n=1 Tax=Streptomyces sp. NBC_00102 TaxID=2975652 RepID=UPI002259A075|nr:Cof-type HAD-IIB family hydrolase [Streptomyces sp. NBC_00102]MCX5398216.1 Cof-type HAD-IIB family hydrolase [Streptomyces sp. NBC_00102]
MRENGPVTTPTEAPPAAVPRLIATDLDGTLLRDDKTLSARTIAALVAAERAGVHVLFVTGRPPRWMDAVASHLPAHGTAICANGAAVVDLGAGGRLIKVHPLGRAEALDVVHRVRAVAPGTTFAVEFTTGFHYEPLYPPFHQDPWATVAPVEKLLDEETPGSGAPVLKLLARHTDIAPDTFLALAREAAGDRVAFTRSSPSALLEAGGAGVSKARTLAEYCAERGVGPEEVVAFGDMPNDVEMLNWAGTSYAMANAHPAAVSAASGRTLTNEEDGVAVVLERLLAAAR